MKALPRTFHIQIAALLIFSVLAIRSNAANALSQDQPQWAAALMAEGAPVTVHTDRKLRTMDAG